MTAAHGAGDTILTILAQYPALSPADAATFLLICAEDGLSLKSLSKHLGCGQSIATRHVTALIEAGLVESRSPSEDSLRRTVHLSKAGCAFKDAIEV